MLLCNINYFKIQSSRLATLPDAALSYMNLIDLVNNNLKASGKFSLKAILADK